MRVARITLFDGFVVRTGPPCTSTELDAWLAEGDQLGFEILVGPLAGTDSLSLVPEEDAESQARGGGDPCEPR